MPQTRPGILLTVLAAAAFLPFLGRRDIVISHEARVVQTAREMAASGWPWNATKVDVPSVKLANLPDASKRLRLVPDPDAPPLHINPWLVPVLNGEIRLQKPPLPYWCSAITFRIAGVEWSEGLSRLIPALLGAICTLLVYDLAQRILGRRFALPAALVWVTSYFIPDEFRKVMADPYLAFYALLAVWAWIRAAIERSPSAIVVFYMAVGLGLLAKGPPLFIHLIFPIGLFHLLKRRGLPGPVWSHLIGIALLVAIALPWPLYVYHHIPHAIDIWRFESIGEMADNVRNAKPLYYYPPLLLQISLPWTPLLLVAIGLPFWRARRLTASRGTAAMADKEFSSQTASLSYARIKVRPAGRGRKRFRGARQVFPLLWYALVVIFFSCVKMKKAAYLLPAMPAQTLMIAQVMVLIAASLRRRRGFSRRKMDEILVFSCTLIAIGLIAFFTFARTPIDNARSPRLACNFIRMALANQPGVTTIPAHLPPEATVYLPLGLSFDPRADTVLYLIDDPKDQAPTDLPAFAQRLPELNLAAVTPVPIPYAGSNPRYKLFRLTLAMGRSKAFAALTGN